MMRWQVAGTDVLHGDPGETAEVPRVPAPSIGRPHGYPCGMILPRWLDRFEQRRQRRHSAPPARKARARAVLTGCVVTISLLVNACVAHPPKSAAERAADERLALAVAAALEADRAIYARHIDIDADRGVILLTGFVWSPDELYEAPRVAGLVPGVTRVVSQIELMVGGRAGSR